MVKWTEGWLAGVLLFSVLPSAPCFSTGGAALRSPARTIRTMQMQDEQNPARTALSRRSLLVHGAAAFVLTTGSAANAQPQVGLGEAKSRRVLFLHDLCSVAPLHTNPRRFSDLRP